MYSREKTGLLEWLETQQLLPGVVGADTQRASQARDAPGGQGTEGRETI